MSDIEFTKVTFNGASFKLEKDARSEKWLHVGKDRIKYSKADSKDGVAKTIRVFFSVDDNIPEKERERLRQHSADQVVPGHDLAVEEYFRRLADEPSQEAAPK